MGEPRDWSGMGAVTIKVSLEGVRQQIVHAISARAAGIDASIAKAVEELDVDELVREEVQRITREEIRRQVQQRVAILVGQKANRLAEKLASRMLRENPDA